MADASVPQKINLTPTGAAATLHQTPHGTLRVVAEQRAGQPPVQLMARYNDQHLVLALVDGPLAPDLSQALLDWQWDALPPTRQGYETWANRLSDFLNGQTRDDADTDAKHSLLVAVIDRSLQQGIVWLAWVGVVGLRVLNAQREAQGLEVGLVAGEGWSAQGGLQPAETQPHVKQLIVNDIDRLLVFSPVLRGLVDELPHMSRAALQRVAEAEAEKGPVVFFDWHPLKVIPEPAEVSLSYRWESPTRVTLSWSGSEEATGFIIEASANPRFDTAETIAELTDHRQRVYTVTPPTDHDVYYRVVPINKNVRGTPSTPVLTTPVPLVPPQIESIVWSQSGHLRVEWTPVPQADIYELEFSPSQDFDSPQTSIVYKGEANIFDVEQEPLPIGWYFRVRTRNSHFMPRLASIWSTPRRAPRQLATPTFRTVSSSVISWTPIDGAMLYEVREVRASDSVVVAHVEKPKYTPTNVTSGTFQVRALRRRADDESSASEWSNAVTIAGGGGLDDDTPVPGEFDNDTDTLPVRTPSTVSSTRLVLLGIGAAVLALFLGLLVGMLGGPRLGVGVDPSPTPLSEADQQATADQETLNQQNAIARATLASDLIRMNVAATENANQLDSLHNQNATLRAQDNQNTRQQQTLTTQLDAAQATGTEISVLQATLQRELDEIAGNVVSLQTTATIQADAVNALHQTGTANAQDQATLDARVNELERTIETFPSLTPTPTLTSTPTPTPMPRLFGKAQDIHWNRLLDSARRVTWDMWSP